MRPLNPSSSPQNPVVEKIHRQAWSDAECKICEYIFRSTTQITQHPATRNWLSPGGRPNNVRSCVYDRITRHSLNHKSASASNGLLSPWTTQMQQHHYTSESVSSGGQSPIHTCMKCYLGIEKAATIYRIAMVPGLKLLPCKNVANFDIRQAETWPADLNLLGDPYFKHLLERIGGIWEC